jgi:hypothetical protein
MPVYPKLEAAPSQYHRGASELWEWWGSLDSNQRHQSDQASNPKPTSHSYGKRRLSYEPPLLSSQLELWIALTRQTTSGLKPAILAPVRSYGDSVWETWIGPDLVQISPSGSRMVWNGPHGTT